jgi:site-specific DNA recombinase
MTNEYKIACALVRVSSDEQARGGYGLEFQEQDIRTFCNRNTFELARVFRDEGFSGATAERPGFKEMMEWARAKRFHILVVWKLDRLFRDTKLTLQTVDELAALGIEVHSVQESFTHDSNGRFLLTIYAAGAEKERRDIALRMHAGRLASARKGTWIAGGGTPPFGYRYDPNQKRLAVDREEAKLVRMMFRWLVNEKLSLYKIQGRINELRIPTKFDRIGRSRPNGVAHWWAKRTIGRILSNEVYQGSFTFRKYAKPGSVHGRRNLRPAEDWVTINTPTIIPKSLFEKAQAQLLNNRRNSPRRTKTHYLLRGLLVCGHDNRRIQAATRPAGRSRECRYYFCSGTRKDVAAVRCPSRSISESRIAPPVWDKLTELLTHPDMVLQQITEYRQKILEPANVADQIELLRIKKLKVVDRHRRLVELYLSSAVDAKFFQAENLSLKLEVDRLDSELERAKSLQMSEQEVASRAQSLQQVFERYKIKLAEASDEVKRELLTLFVNRVTVRGEELEICVNLPEPDSFVGQSPRRLSHKDTSPYEAAFSIFLHARLLTVSEVFRQNGHSRNLGRWAMRHVS